MFVLLIITVNYRQKSWGFTVYAQLSLKNRIVKNKNCLLKYRVYIDQLNIKLELRFLEENVSGVCP